MVWINMRRILNNKFKIIPISINIIDNIKNEKMKGDLK